MSMAYLAEHDTLEALIQQLNDLRDELARNGLTNVKVAKMDRSVDVIDNVTAEIRTVREIANYNGMGYNRVELEEHYNSGVACDNSETVVFLD